MIRQYWLICTCLLGPFLINGQESKWDLSDENLGELVDIELKLFQSSDQLEADSLLFVKSSIYKRVGQYVSALTTLDRISPVQDAKMETKLLNEQILLHYLLEEYKMVENLLLQTTFISDYESSNEIQLIEALTKIQLGELEEAKKCLYRILPDSDRVDLLFGNKSFRNPETAFKLSFILPGSGQMYAGHMFKGLISLTTQSILFYTGVNGIKRNYFFTEALPSIAIFQGFYFGGAEYAKKLTMNRNDQMVQLLSREVVSEIKKKASLSN